MKNVDKDAFLSDVAQICWEQGLNETGGVENLCSLVIFISPVIDNHAHVKSSWAAER